MLQGSPEFHFHCFSCGADAPLSDDFACTACGLPVSLQPTSFPDSGLFSQPPPSIWHYRSLLPLALTETPVHLGEGGTPILSVPPLAEQCRLGAVDLKNELENPTGSFKDRQVAVGINWARSQGHHTVMAVSSGSVAVATAAYAAKAGIRAVVLVHGHAEPAKVLRAQTLGATVITVDDPSPHTVFQLCIDACKKHGWYHLSTAGIYEPWNVEGAKTIAYELFQHYGRTLPHWLIAPVGGGGLLGGIWRGFLDLKAMGLITDIPRLAGVQAAGCAPLVEAIENDWTLEEHFANPWDDPDTEAGALADDILFDGHTVLPAIRQTWGTALPVGDDEMRAAQGSIGELTGLHCDLAAASAVAALGKLPVIDRDTRVCCILSGGTRSDEAPPNPPIAAPPVISADPAALEALLRDAGR